MEFLQDYMAVEVNPSNAEQFLSMSYCGHA